MQIRKSTEVVGGGVPTAAQLEAIQAQAKGKLTQEQVYVFSVRLCDDQVDRDMERFDTQALPELARLFIGKTGIIDHNWSSDRQIARIFATEVVREEGVSFIRAWAYIRRSEKSDEIIADIEAGIKREVSVGCAMGRAVCSICGGEYGTCGHRKGEYYDGQLCCAVLREPLDAYEFSFVAVPAQREAGVIKGLAHGAASLKELAERYGAQGEYQGLCKLAELGRRYESDLHDEVVRLSLVLELGVEEPVLRSIVKLARTDDLLRLRAALQRRLEESLPMQTQLTCPAGEFDAPESGYLI